MPAVSDFIQRGTAANRPTASALTAGQLYHSTDTGVIERDNGSSWDLFAVDSTLAIPDTIVDAKGDLIVATAADTVARMAVGADDKELVADASATPGLAWVENHPWIKTGAGVIYPAFADGNLPMVAFQNASGSSVGITISGANVGTAVARMVKFRLPRTLAVTDFYIYPASTPTNDDWTFAVYPVGASTAKTWSNDMASATANTWYNASGLSFTLNANTDYWFCIAARLGTSPASFRTPQTVLNAAFYGSEDAPLGGLSVGIPEYAEIAVTAGSWPANLPTVDSAGNGGTWTGAAPYAYFKGTGS